MGPGLPCDCAVNTAVLSQREPARHRETLSSLLLLIEKPIAIYVLTLDTESIPRGAAPAKPRLGWPSHLRPPCSCRCDSAEAAPDTPLQLQGDRQVGTLHSRELVSRGISFIHEFSEGAEMWVPEVPGACGLEQLDSFCPACFPGTSTAEPDGLSGIHTHLLRKT